MDSQTRLGLATPLHRASYGGHEDILKLLLANGANPTQPDADGLTAVDKASKESNARCGKDHASDVHRCGFEGRVTTEFVLFVRLILRCNHMKLYERCREWLVGTCSHSIILIFSLKFNRTRLSPPPIYVPRIVRIVGGIF